MNDNLPFHKVILVFTLVFIVSNNRLIKLVLNEGKGSNNLLTYLVVSSQHSVYRPEKYQQFFYKVHL